VGAFFALGVARRTGRPVAVITTSGTAVTELLSTAAEAFHTGVPLVFVTADRPRRLRGTGAPQAIDQVGLFSKFAGLEFDLEHGEDFSLAGWNRRAPVHLNVCFDEPLIDEKPVEREPPVAGAEPGAFAGLSGFARESGAEWAAVRLTKFLREREGLVVVVGSLETARERDAVAAFLMRTGAPAYLEATSGLRERPELEALALRSGDRLLSWAIKRQLIRRVLRIGGVPTARIWRDLDEAACAIDVLSLTPLPFPGLSRGEMICAEIAPVVAAVDVKAGSIEALAHKDRAATASCEKIFAGEPFSEPALIRRLSEKIPADSLVYVGNSLPIREWDLAAAHSRPFTVQANRGVNGIDGQISTFLGLAERGVENWGVIGDLTALYDLAAPWALGARSADLKFRLVVVNNGGGKIFSRLFKSNFFENRHDLRFEHWARMWNLDYQQWTEIPDRLAASDREVIELRPDPVSTQLFWDRYDALWE